MRATFGNTFELVVPPFGGLLYWQGTIEINMSILDSPFHSLKLVYPKEYPNRPAEAYCIKPRIYSEKHQYEDGQLCLFNPKDGEQYGWNPSKSRLSLLAAGQSNGCTRITPGGPPESGPALRSASKRALRFHAGGDAKYANSG